MVRKIKLDGGGTVEVRNDATDDEVRRILRDVAKIGKKALDTPPAE